MVEREGVVPSRAGGVSSGSQPRGRVGLDTVPRLGPGVKDERDRYLAPELQLAGRRVHATETDAATATQSSVLLLRNRTVKWVSSPNSTFGQQGPGLTSFPG